MAAASGRMREEEEEEKREVMVLNPFQVVMAKPRRQCAAHDLEKAD
jgi:hypothetical protein